MKKANLNILNFLKSTTLIKKSIIVCILISILTPLSSPLIFSLIENIIGTNYLTTWMLNLRVIDISILEISGLLWIARWVILVLFGYFNGLFLTSFKLQPQYIMTYLIISSIIFYLLSIHLLFTLGLYLVDKRFFDNAFLEFFNFNIP